MPTKATAELQREARRLHDAGESWRAVGERLGVSKNTAKAWAEAAPPEPVSGQVAAVEDPDEPAEVGSQPEAFDPDAIRRDLQNFINELRADAKRARAAGDHVSVQRAQKLAVDLNSQLLRAAKSTPEAEGFVRVDAKEMEKVAGRARERLRAAVARAREKVDCDG